MLFFVYMKNIKFTNNNLEIKSNTEKPNPSKEMVNFDNQIKEPSVNQEMNDKQEIIDNTINEINNIRQELGSPTTLELPPSVKQIKESIDKLKSKAEYFKEIPIEKGKYYRVTGISELRSIIKNKTLTTPDKSYYDRSMLSKIAKNSGYSIDDLELINSDNPEEIRELYKKYISEPNKAEGKVTIVARTKSNHGDIGFVKEGFFYNPMNENSSHFGAPVIVGSEDKSLFESGVHGSHYNIFNEDIGPNKPVVLKGGMDVANFEYWLHEEEKGWSKNNFDDLQIKFENKNKENE